jgi:hypothetical protein
MLIVDSRPFSDDGKDFSLRDVFKDVFFQGVSKTENILLKS